MTQADIPSSPTPREERRRHLRRAFSPSQRPSLLLPTGRYDVLDASLSGVRVRHTALARPTVGSGITGRLEWPHGEPPLQVSGTIVRVGRSYYAMTCEPVLPRGYLPWSTET